MADTSDDLATAITDLALKVSAAEERKDDRAFVTETHLAVEAMAARYKAYYDGLSDAEKMKADRGLGRRMLDIKRSAALLPRVGVIAGSTPDRQVAGASVMTGRRLTGVDGTGVPTGTGNRGLRVGGDIEAWCGPCNELTDHRIVAMVGDTPKQVVCEACNNRHGYRTTPARARTASTAPSEDDSWSGDFGGGSARPDPKAAELRALANELAAAEDVKPFDPAARYKAGDVISHPEYGRGRVDSVLGSNLLVRFGGSGLKSLTLR